MSCKTISPTALQPHEHAPFLRALWHTSLHPHTIRIYLELEALKRQFMHQAPLLRSFFFLFLFKNLPCRTSSYTIKALPSSNSYIPPLSCQYSCCHQNQNPPKQRTFGSLGTKAGKEAYPVLHSPDGVALPIERQTRRGRPIRHLFDAFERVRHVPNAQEKVGPPRVLRNRAAVGEIVERRLATVASSAGLAHATERRTGEGGVNEGIVH